MTSDAYNAGYLAYLAGDEETANPYDLATEEEAHLSWNDGWQCAADDESED